MYEKLAPMVASGALPSPVAGEFSLKRYSEALGVAEKYNGKAILNPNHRP
jgi:hypothetical protein